MFSKNSPFGDNDALIQHARLVAQAKDRLPEVPVKYVGQPNVVEIPLTVLEDWMGELDGYMHGSFTDLDPDFETVLEQMRSYLKG